jgi:hypothetical protein
MFTNGAHNSGSTTDPISNDWRITETVTDYARPLHHFNHLQVAQ